MTRGENNELHWFWRFFFFSIFLNRDFGCIKTRIYNLFGLSVLNSTFICRSTITTNLSVSRKLHCYCACVLSSLAAILLWWTKWPSLLCSFRVANISHQYRYFLRGWFRRGCKTFSSCENIYFSVLHSDLIVCGNLFLFFLWVFCLFLFVLTEWDFFLQISEFTEEENHSREMGYVTITIIIVFGYCSSWFRG